MPAGGSSSQSGSITTTGLVGREYPAAVACILIVAAALLAYFNSFGGPFVFDDPPSILYNRTIRHLWPLSSVFRPPNGEGITVGGRPVLNLSLAVNYAISGTQVWSYHALNLLIHILAGLTLFGIVLHTLRDRQNCERSSTWAAFAVALLWTVHPLQTESVTYVIQRAESLMGLFYLLTLYCFIRASEAGGSRRRVRLLWYALSIAACQLGMATKEVMVSAPLVVLLYDRTFLAGSASEAWRMRWRYYLSLATSWVLLAALVAGGGGNRGGSMGLGATTWLPYLIAQFSAIATYLRLVFWPHPLVIDYPIIHIDHPIQVLPQALLMLALFAGTLWALRFRPSIGFLGACFFLILGPTSLMPSATQMIAEHRMYLPLAAVLGVVVCLGDAISGGRRVLFVAAAVAVIFATVTFRRNAVYVTDFALWSDTVADSPQNPVAHNNLGLDLAGAGRTAEAIEHYQEALKIDPNYSSAHNNLGVILDETGRTEEAIKHYRDALRIDPANAKANSNLGIALIETGRPFEAVESFRRALLNDPKNPGIRYNYAVALRAAGKFAEAQIQFEEAGRLRADVAQPR
jgi:tetratricopeptide (TPR) repeat protein